jgi:hypothetical protein
MPKALSKHMQTRPAGKRRPRPSRGVAPVQATGSGPTRIPGVHIGHIGGRIGAVEEIRAYWQARGAVFMHLSLEAGEHQSQLEETLERSHIVFHGDAGGELGRSLERYCERKGKPLILLEANSVAALAEALADSLPLT